MFSKQTIDDYKLAGKQVLLRVDFNVPIENGKVMSDFRIQQAIPTIKALQKKGCKIVICSHLGRPKSPEDTQYSLKPVAKVLSRLLGNDVTFAADCIGDDVKKAASRLKPKEIMLLENLRFYPEEKKNDKEAETALAKNVVVHFWKGDLALLTDAAKKGYSIVNSLHSSTYLDYNYKSIPLKKAYSFNPIPNGLAEKYHKNIYGLGCQMWSEWTPTNADVEKQTYPRIAAYAEVGWTNTENKNYTNFTKALTKMQQHWATLGINYYKEALTPNNK